MAEMVFGSLATTDKRADHAQARMRGVQHGYEMSPRAVQAGESPTLTVTVELDRQVDRVECLLPPPQSSPKGGGDLVSPPSGRGLRGGSIYPLNLIKTQWDLLNWAYYQVWQVTLPPQAEGALVRYQILAYPADGSEPIYADEDATFSYLVGNPAQPEWAREAVVYQIFPDRFYPGNGRVWNQTTNLDDIYGGTLRGIIEKLDYIADLGFNTIWLNPFFPDDTHHGYHATDYFAVNPRLGTLDDIRELVAAAHERGIRLLLDFVANHWSNEHATFRAAQADKNSEYYDWYIWHEWPHDYKTFFGVKELPQLNLDHRPAREHLLKAARYWLADIGFDGLRLDYVLGPSHDFWTELRATVKAISPDIWLFGEAVDAPDAQLKYAGRFDGNLDFLLAQALRNTFGFGTMNVAAFDAFLRQHEAYFPTYFGRPSFLDNHDQNRFLWLARGDTRKLKLAALCQFTLPGAPIVYNGTEVGVSQTRDKEDASGVGMAEVRQPMVWGDAQDESLLNYYKWLIDFRRQHPVLRQGKRQTLHVDAVGTYVYAVFDADEVVLVAFNLSDQEQEIVVSVPDRSELKTFMLPPWGGAVQVTSYN